MAAAVGAPHGSPAAAVLALQQTAGNRATTRFLSRQPHTVHKPLADIVRLRTLAEHAKDRRDLLASYIKAARDDLKRYRERFREVDKRYTAAYEMYKGTLKTMNASADTEQFIVNQVFSLLNNLTVGTLGNALQEAKLVGAATNLYGARRSTRRSATWLHRSPRQRSRRSSTRRCTGRRGCRCSTTSTRWC